jgi:hypothetical protein
MANRLCDVIIEGISGSLLVKWDSIKGVRVWARKAFPGSSVTVSVHKEYRGCDVCSSQPCVCQKPPARKPAIAG